MNAQIISDTVVVRHSMVDGVSYLAVSIGGWDEVRKLQNKTLVFNGVNHGFSAWNSDKNEAYFRSNQKFAKIV